MAPASRNRRLLGKLPTMGDREVVYLCDDAVESDIVDGYSVESRRVFFSDVQLITWHRQFSVAGLWIGGGSLLLAIVIFALLLSMKSIFDPLLADSALFWILFWVIVAPNIPILVWFLRPYAYITVFGKRNRAVMRWHFHHGRSRRVFEELTVLVRSYQQRAQAQVVHSAQAQTVAVMPQPPAASAQDGADAMAQPAEGAGIPLPTNDHSPRPLS